MKKQVDRSNQYPDNRIEASLQTDGYLRIAGLDEAGRGALAGPVVAAVVILPNIADFPWLKSVRDSKLLSPGMRENIFKSMQEAGIEQTVGIVSASAIDDINILNATKKAMLGALKLLANPPDFILTDAVRLPRIRTPQRNIIKGDRICLSIACASIVAKVTRDHIMDKMDSEFPHYGFINHKGYGTQEHLEALHKYGACRMHRMTFGPVRDLSRML